MIMAAAMPVPNSASHKFQVAFSYRKPHRSEDRVTLQILVASEISEGVSLIHWRVS